MHFYINILCSSLAVSEAEDEKHIYGNDNMAFVKEDKPKKLGKGKQVCLI